MNDEQLQRYSRQIMLPEFDYQGQQRILSSRVLIIGLGGLGSPVALYLASAGVGTLVLVDDDVVDQSNLQRQIIHSEADIGVSKVVSAQQSIAALNSDVLVEPLQQRLKGEGLSEEVKKALKDKLYGRQRGPWLGFKRRLYIKCGWIRGRWTG